MHQEKGVVMNSKQTNYKRIGGRNTHVGHTPGSYVAKHLESAFDLLHVGLILGIHPHLIFH
jgi:hypothetical protein